VIGPTPFFPQPVLNGLSQRTINAAFRSRSAATWHLQRVVFNESPAHESSRGWTSNGRTGVARPAGAGASQATMSGPSWRSTGCSMRHPTAPKVHYRRQDCMIASWLQSSRIPTKTHRPQSRVWARRIAHGRATAPADRHCTGGLADTRTAVTSRSGIDPDSDCRFCLRHSDDGSGGPDRDLDLHARHHP